MSDKSKEVLLKVTKMSDLPVSLRFFAVDEKVLIQNMNYRTYIFCFFLVLVLAAPSVAAGPQISGHDLGHVTVDHGFDYRTSFLDSYSWQPLENPRSGVVAVRYRVDLDYVFKWKLSILMGEPVVIGQLVYKPTQVQIGDPSLYLTLNSKEFLSKIRMTEFKMKVHMYLEPSGSRAMDRGAVVHIDAGSPGKPYMGNPISNLVDDKELFAEYASFNTPGSPNWNELFTNIEDKQQTINYFNALDSAASKRDRYYASYYNHTVEKITIDSSAIDAHIRAYLQKREQEAKEKYAVKSREVQQQADELDAALAETESGDSASDDIFADDSTAGDKSFEELLEESEKIKLTLNEVPRSTAANVITVSGRVENISSIDSSEIVFRVNGLEQPVYLAEDGSFSNKVVLFNGENQIDINYSSGAGNERRTVLVTSSTPPVKARFTLTWNSGGSDMDLHVVGPDGGHCSYNNKTTGNMQLDVDNRSGYGPENISVKLNQHPGTYNVYVKHYEGNAGDVTLYIYLDNRLVATERAHLSGREKWSAYSLDID